MVQILGGGFAGMDLVFHAIQTRHQQCRKAQVRVHQRIREARLHTAALGVGHVGDADRSGAILGRVSQFHRRLEVRNQALVAVGTRVRDRVQRAGVLDDAADVIQRKVRQAGIAVARKQVLSVFPDRLMHVHARSIVARVRLGHERSRLAIGIGHVVNHVLLQLRPVGPLNQRAEPGTNLVLAGACHFVVEHFDRYTE